MRRNNNELYMNYHKWPCFGFVTTLRRCTSRILFFKIYNLFKNRLIIIEHPSLSYFIPRSQRCSNRYSSHAKDYPKTYHQLKDLSMHMKKISIHIINWHFEPTFVPPVSIFSAYVIEWKFLHVLLLIAWAILFPKKMYIWYAEVPARASAVWL